MVSSTFAHTIPEGQIQTDKIHQPRSDFTSGFAMTY